MARSALSRAGLVGAWLLKGYGEEGDKETLGRKRSPVSCCPAYTLARGDECWVSMQCTGEKSIFYEVG
jgi:hypothetical protein